MDLLKQIYPADRLNDDGVPSASFAIQDPSGHVETGIISNGPENTETIYQACSVSKAITALAVAKLADEGKLSYETKVYEYIPASIRQSIGSESLLQLVTIGHLLTHRSGLSRHGLPGYPEGQEMPTYEQFFAGVPPSLSEKIRFLSFPGAQFAYSGGGITLLQVALENFTRMPFAKLMWETVLNPLGMIRSQFENLPQEERNFAKAHYTAYIRGTEIGRGYHRFMELAAAGLWTTPTDILKALSAIQKSLRGNDGFLSQAIAKKMLTAVEVEIDPKDMALGWFSDANFFAHSGDNWPGYTCFAIASHGGAANQSSQEEDNSSAIGQTAVVVMTNGFSTNAWPAIQKYISGIFYKTGIPRLERLPCFFGSFTDLIPAALPEIPSLKFGRWREWTGKWSHGWEILDHNGAPYVLFTGAETPVKLLPAAGPSRTDDELPCVAEGLSMALWLTSNEEDEKTIYLMQKQKQTLKRV